MNCFINKVCGNRTIEGLGSIREAACVVWILGKDGFEFGLDSNWSFQLELRLFEVPEDFGRSCLPVGVEGDINWRIWYG